MANTKSQVEKYLEAAIAAKTDLEGKLAKLETEKTDAVAEVVKLRDELKARQGGAGEAGGAFDSDACSITLRRSLKVGDAANPLDARTIIGKILPLAPGLTPHALAHMVTNDLVSIVEPEVASESPAG